MYNQRRQQLQAQTLRPEQVDLETPSIATQSLLAPSVSLQHETASAKATTQRTANFVVLEEAEMDTKTRKNLPKNTTFQPLPELALRYFRELLTKEYRTTLNEIVQNTGRVNEYDLTRILQPVVVEIDRRLRQLTFPGAVDPQLFNIELDTILEKLKKDMENEYLDIAQTIGLKVRNCETALVREQDELDEWIEKNKRARESLRTLPSMFLSQDQPDDYVQSLIKYPSQIAFDL